MKTKEEILKEKLVPEVYSETEFEEGSDFEYYKKEVLEAMEEYANQFKPIQFPFGYHVDMMESPLLNQGKMIMLMNKKDLEIYQKSIENK